MYVLKTYDGVQIRLQDEEATKVLLVINQGQQKSLFVQGNYLAVSNISSVTKESVERGDKDHTIGVLLDGRTVIKQFGQWYLMNSDFLDENGRYYGRPDVNDCPEIRYDCVPSVEEYERKYAELGASEARALLCGEREERRRAAVGFQSTGALIESHPALST